MIRGGAIAIPKSNLEIKRVPFLVYRGLEGNLNPKKGIRAWSGSEFNYGNDTV